MSDYYDTLSAGDAANFRNALFQAITGACGPAPWDKQPCAVCDGWDISGIASPDDLQQLQLRTILVHCYQVWKGISPAGGLGTVDRATYSSVVGFFAALTTGEKVAGLGALGVALYLMFGKKRRGRR